MQRDAKLLRVPMPDDAMEFQRDLLRLVDANNGFNSTLRVAIVRNRGGLFEGEGIARDFDIVAFTADVHNWGRGVHLGLQEQGRHSGSIFAGTKVTSWCYNLTFLEIAKSNGYDEVVLLDDKGRVSECTSANIFAVTERGVLTPPLESGCLPGITREILLNDVRVPGTNVREGHLMPNDLFSAHGVFITSTTRELLPVFSVAGKQLSQEHSVRNALQEAFSAFCDRYVETAQQTTIYRTAAGAIEPK